jgi:antitoxin component YwqK of YwqJK toxin-antitoxin module
MIQSAHNSELETENKSWWSNGIGDVYLRSIFRDENQNEHHKRWYENGQLMVHESYKDGKPEGNRKVWYDNGHLMVDSFYKNGEFEGRYKTWHENGCPEQLIFYKNGNHEGEYRVFHETGQIECHLIYLNGTYTCSLGGNMKPILLRAKNKLQSEVMNLIFIKTFLINDLIGIV